ncbi:MAG: SLOG family protein [Ruminococcus sp.]|nr:SLOG family protein [Ruminococcus sp.]
MITENKVTHYISGMALGIDQICAELVLEIKSRYPKITLECAIPCEEQAIRWTEPQRDRYFSILERCDKETIIICGIQSSLIIMVFLFQSTVNRVRIFLRL